MGDKSLRGRSKILKKTYGPYKKRQQQSIEIGKKSKELWPRKQVRMPKN